MFFLEDRICLIIFMLYLSVSIFFFWSLFFYQEMEMYIVVSGVYYISNLVQWEKSDMIVVYQKLYFFMFYKWFLEKKIFFQMLIELVISFFENVFFVIRVIVNFNVERY